MQLCGGQGEVAPASSAAAQATGRATARQPLAPGAAEDWERAAPQVCPETFCAPTCPTETSRDESEDDASSVAAAMPPSLAFPLLLRLRYQAINGCLLNVGLGGLRIYEGHIWDYMRTHI